MHNNEEIKTINEQMLATLLFIGTLIVSFSLSYDRKEKIKGNKGIYTKNQVRIISIANRIAVLTIVLFFFYIDKENIEIAKIQNKDVKLLYLQELIEIITTITAILALYITIKNNTNDSVGIENPHV